jgi:hypothetical protein
MDLARHLPGMDPALRRLLGRMTDPDPEGRPASAAAALDELEHAVPSSPTAATDDRGSAPPIVEDDILPNDGTIPQPILFVLLALLSVVGVFGTAAFFMFDVALAPFGFALARAFVSAPTRKRLHAKEQDLRETLRGVRGGFQAMAKRGAHGLGRRRLGPRPPRPRLPPGER